MWCSVTTEKLSTQQVRHSCDLKTDTFTLLRYSFKMTSVFKKIFSFGQKKSCDNLEEVIHRSHHSTLSHTSMGPGEYVLGELLGQGGFGQVFSGQRKPDHKEVVIKEVRKDERFRKDNMNNNNDCGLPLEIQLMLRVQSVPGVVKILDYFDEGDSYYIVMEKLKKCQDLFDFITEKGRLSESEARRMFRRIVETVVGCRDAGVLHRDIKDENILVDLSTGATRLIDFGSGCFLPHAKVTPGEDEDDRVYTEFRGTRVYSPPEWVRDGEYRADGLTVWSLGVLLHDMLAGDIPFDNDEMITRGMLPWTRHLGLSEEALDLVRQCLTVNTQLRISLDNILTHHWLRESSTVTSSSSLTSLMSTSPAKC